jgi:hypothetical protein
MSPQGKGIQANRGFCGDVFRTIAGTQLQGEHLSLLPEGNHQCGSPCASDAVPGERDGSTAPTWSDRSSGVRVVSSVVARQNTIHLKMGLVMKLRTALTVLLGPKWLIDDCG